MTPHCVLPSRCHNVCTIHVHLRHAGRSSGVHGTTCQKSTGYHMRHNAVNDLIKRAMASANVPSKLKPNSLSIDDGKRRDSLTMLPWAMFGLGLHMSRYFGNQSLEPFRAIR